MLDYILAYPAQMHIRIFTC